MTQPAENKRAHSACDRMGSIDSTSQLIVASIPDVGMNGEMVVDLSSYVHDPVLGNVTVRVHEYGHLVTCDPRLLPRYHHVYADACNCRLGPACPAVRVVAHYLGEGGMIAPTPPEGCVPYVPWSCPVCGERAARADQLSSRRRGEGWVCTTYGESHYWEYHSSLLHKYQSMHS